jgi:hypothetical protein
LAPGHTAINNVSLSVSEERSASVICRRFHIWRPLSPRIIQSALLVDPFPAKTHLAAQPVNLTKQKKLNLSAQRFSFVKEEETRIVKKNWKTPQVLVKNYYT